MISAICAILAVGLFGVVHHWSKQQTENAYQAIPIRINQPFMNRRR